MLNDRAGNGTDPCANALPLEPLLLSVEEAAEVLRLGRSTLYELIASGEIPSLTIGRSRRVPLAALKEWVAARTAAQATDASGDSRDQQGSFPTWRSDGR